MKAAWRARQCDESCGRGCPHSPGYDFDCELSGEIGEQWAARANETCTCRKAPCRCDAARRAQEWSERAFSSLLQFIERLDWSLPEREIESRLLWWWRGENHALRREMEAVHRTRCERGRGVVVNVATGQVVPNRCKSWRDCAYCAWVYGRRVARLFSQVKRLAAFAVFTMPPELGDWSNKDHLKAQAQALHRLAERLLRRFGHRFSMLWAREHNTKRRGPGRLHLNVLWDEHWVDQAWLSETARGCGFGSVVWIERIGKDGELHTGEGRGRPAARYATKCLSYASKDLKAQADWPKYTRRWGASRSASVQMKRPATNPDWFYAPFGLPGSFDTNSYEAVAAACTCRTIPCRCGAWARAQASARRSAAASLTPVCAVCRGECEWCADPGVIVCGRCHPPPASFSRGHRWRGGLTLAHLV